MELADSCTVRCGATGLMATISFKAGSAIKGAVVRVQGAVDTPIARIGGSWEDEIVVESVGSDAAGAQREGGENQGERVETPATYRSHSHNLHKVARMQTPWELTVRGHLASQIDTAKVAESASVSAIPGRGVSLIRKWMALLDRGHPGRPT